MRLIQHSITVVLLFIAALQAQAQRPHAPGTQAGDPEAPISVEDNKTTQEDEVFIYVDEAPVFKEGDFTAYVMNNYIFTDKMFKTGKPGIIYVGFTVEKDGSVTNVNIPSEKGLTPLQDTEAIRVIQSSSGKWIPGKINGQSIRSKFKQKFIFPEDTFE